MSDCIFCQIASGESPATIDLENDSIIAFRSIAPAASVHVLIVPKKHISGFEDISKEDASVVSAMVGAAQKLIKEKELSDGYKLIINGGKYQAINHLHWHLLGGKMQENFEDKL